MITPDQVRHVARLARLELNDAEVETHARHLSKVLALFDELDAIDTTGVEPTARALPLRNVLRADVSDPALDAAGRDRLLAAAPEREGPYVRVPRILGEG